MANDDEVNTADPTMSSDETDTPPEEATEAPAEGFDPLAMLRKVAHMKRKAEQSATPDDAAGDTGDTDAAGDATKLSAGQKAAPASPEANATAVIEVRSAGGRRRRRRAPGMDSTLVSGLKPDKPLVRTGHRADPAPPPEPKVITLEPDPDSPAKPSGLPESPLAAIGAPTAAAQHDVQVAATVRADDLPKAAGEAKDAQLAATVRADDLPKAAKTREPSPFAPAHASRALALAELFVMPDDGVDDFVAREVGERSALTARDVLRMRELLHALSAALEQTDDAALDQLRRACDAIERSS